MLCGLEETLVPKNMSSNFHVSYFCRLRHDHFYKDSYFCIHPLLPKRLNQDFFLAAFFRACQHGSQYRVCSIEVPFHAAYTTESALDGAVFDIAQILAYLIHNMSRSQLYLGFGHFG